jgi:hypothetical protein
MGSSTSRESAMHETFVTGPIGTRGLRLAERCKECAGTTEARGCTGFGAGCLALAQAGDREALEAPGRWSPRRMPTA